MIYINIYVIVALLLTCGGYANKTLSIIESMIINESKAIISARKSEQPVALKAIFLTDEFQNPVKLYRVQDFSCANIKFVTRNNKFWSFFPYGKFSCTFLVDKNNTQPLECIVTGYEGLTIKWSESDFPFYTIKSPLSSGLITVVSIMYPENIKGSKYITCEVQNIPKCYMVMLIVFVIVSPIIIISLVLIKILLVVFSKNGRFFF